MTPSFVCPPKFDAGRPSMVFEHHHNSSKTLLCEGSLGIVSSLRLSPTPPMVASEFEVGAHECLEELQSTFLKVARTSFI